VNPSWLNSSTETRVDRKNYRSFPDSLAAIR
jgi:hypothetical protein